MVNNQDRYEYKYKICTMAIVVAPRTSYTLSPHGNNNNNNNNKGQNRILFSKCLVKYT